MKHWLMTCSTVAAVLVAGVCVAKPLPQSKAPTESWYEFLFFEKKVGFLRTRHEPTKINGKPAFLTQQWSVNTLHRENHVIRMEATIDCWFAPDGTPIRFNHQRTEGKEARSVDGYRDGTQFVVRRDIGGNVQEERLPLKGLRLASSIDFLFFQKLFVGKKAAGRALEESQGHVIEYSIEVAGTVKQGSKMLFRVLERLGNIKSEVLVDADGVVEVIRVQDIGASYRRVSRDKAMKMPDRVLDIFSSGLFELKTPIPPGDELERLVVHIWGRSGRRPESLQGRLQSAKPKGKSGLVLTMKADVPPPRRLTRGKKVPKKVAPYLEATPYEPLNDEALQATVERLVAPKDDAWTAAKAINRFVYRHIRNKSLAKGFSAATEALESAEGDCTEHAVLFSALAKIAKIPTRLIAGFVYVSGRNVFGYHQWVEVWMGNRWIPMDPTFGQDVADPTHIKFTEGRSDPDGLREAGRVAAMVIGDLQLEVVEYTTVSGKTKKL